MHQLWKISVLNKNQWLLPGERTVINSCFPSRYGTVMCISHRQCICIVQYHRDDFLEFYSNFLEKLSSLSNSIVFLCFFHCPLEKAFLSLLAIFWNSAFSWIYLSLSSMPFASLFSSYICKVSSDNYFAFMHFFFFGMVSITVSCTMLQICP